MAQVPKRWSEVVQSEGYQALSPEQKTQAQNQYFNDVVAPQVPEGEREAAYNQFTTQNPVAPQVDPRQQLIDAAIQQEQVKKANRQANGVVSTSEMMNGESSSKVNVEDLVVALNAANNPPRSTAGGYVTQPNDPRSSVNPDAMRAPTRDDNLAAQYEGETSKAGAVVDNVAQGLTFGFSDEIEARLRSTFGDESYEAALQDTRARMAANEAESPIASILANLTGEVVLGTSMARNVDTLVDVASAGNKARGATQVGAATAEGAAQGVGYSQAEIGTQESNDAAGTGALFGLIGGGLGEAANVGLNRTMDSATFNQSAGQRSIQRQLQDIQADQNLSDEDLVNQVVEQLEQVQRGGGDAVLADVDGLQDLARGANQTTQIDQGIRENIGGRQRTLERNFLESVDPTFSADQSLAGNTFPNSNVGGVEITQNEIIPRSGRSQVDDAGIVNLNAYSEAARREGNTQAAELYEAAYSRRPTEDEIAVMEESISQSPLLQRAFSTGQSNARDINLANGNVNTDPSFVQVLDETSKVLGNMLRNTEATQSRAAISGLKNQLDESINVFAPELQQARDAARAGQRTRGFVEGGKQAVDSQSIDAVDDFVRTYDFGTPEARQAALGAGRAVREAVYNQVSRGTRDAGTGKLLNTRQVEQYNRVLEGMPEREVVNTLLDADSRAFRTKEISETNRRGWQEELRRALPTDLRGAATLASLAAVIATPSPIAFSVAAARAGQVAAARMNDRQLAKQLQRELFTAMDGSTEAKKQYVENLLKGDFGNIPSKQLEAMGRGIATAIGSLSAQENIEAQER